MPSGAPDGPFSRLWSASPPRASRRGNSRRSASCATVMSTRWASTGGALVAGLPCRGKTALRWQSRRARCPTCDIGATAQPTLRGFVFLPRRAGLSCYGMSTPLPARAGGHLLSGAVGGYASAVASAFLTFVSRRSVRAGEAMLGAAANDYGCSVGTHAGATERPSGVSDGHFPLGGGEGRPVPRGAGIRGVLPPVRLPCPLGGLPPVARLGVRLPCHGMIPCAGNRGALGHRRALLARRPNQGSVAFFRELHTKVTKRPGCQSRPSF